MMEGAAAVRVVRLWACAALFEAQAVDYLMKPVDGGPARQPDWSASVTEAAPEAGG
jgi:hypothetical protein